MASKYGEKEVYKRSYSVTEVASLMGITKQTLHAIVWKLGDECGFKKVYNRYYITAEEYVNFEKNYPKFLEKYRQYRKELRMAHPAPQSQTLPTKKKKPKVNL